MEVSLVNAARDMVTVVEVLHTVARAARKCTVRAGRQASSLSRNTTKTKQRQTETIEASPYVCAVLVLKER